MISKDGMRVHDMLKKQKDYEEEHGKWILQYTHNVLQSRKYYTHILSSRLLLSQQMKVQLILGVRTSAENDTFLSV